MIVSYQQFWEADARKSWVQGQNELYSKILSQNETKKSASPTTYNAR